jgi:hypothetical protein
LEFIYLALTAFVSGGGAGVLPHVARGARERQIRKRLGLLPHSRGLEAKERVASADVVSLKETQARYAGRQFDELYEKWRQGTVADIEVTRHAGQVEPSGKDALRTMVCGSSLSVFSDRRGNGPENCGENVIGDGLPQVSSSRSLQISGT